MNKALWKLPAAPEERRELPTASCVVSAILHR